MPRLLLINGLPGSGKSTLAARYVAERPLALCLDVDVVRGLLGAWSDRPHEAGLLARRLALAMARLVLGEGRDVVVPQFLARPAFIGEPARETYFGYYIPDAEPRLIPTRHHRRIRRAAHGRDAELSAGEFAEAFREVSDAGAAGACERGSMEED